MDEFALIERYFNRSNSSKSVVLGIGDDAAALAVPSGQLLVQTLDTLHAGYHFPHETCAFDIAWKSLAVNVSDLVAMGADPAYFLMSLTLPEADEAFLQGFAEGLFSAADAFSIELVGGDTCKGPLSISIQASGFAAEDQLLRRDLAQPGDALFVTGQLGLAALGLAVVQGELSVDSELKAQSIAALNRPVARLDCLPVLRQFASAAIDLSDGLAGDLRHVLKRSEVGVTLIKDQLPVAPWIRNNDRYELALSGGDDYQIAFSVRPEKISDLQALIKKDHLDMTQIGMFTANGYWLRDSANSQNFTDLNRIKGYMHFGR